MTCVLIFHQKALLGLQNNWEDSQIKDRDIIFYSLLKAAPKLVNSKSPKIVTMLDGPSIFIRQMSLLYCVYMRKRTKPWKSYLDCRQSSGFC